MPGVLPEGEPVPADGALPDPARATVGARGFGVYVHVPFCASRCGYCDFNTYTAAELGGADAPPGASRQSYAEAARRETRFAAGVLGSAVRPVSTVFLGGGTPTLLPPAHLVGMLAEGRATGSRWGLGYSAGVGNGRGSNLTRAGDAGGELQDVAHRRLTISRRIRIGARQEARQKLADRR